MESKLLLLVNRHDQWSYVRLTNLESDDDQLALTFIPRPDDHALDTILAEYRGLVGLACDNLTCHASIRDVERNRSGEEELVTLRCRRLTFTSTLELIAEEKMRQWELEWDKPLRGLARYDGMMGFAEAPPVRPGFVTLVNHTAWRILLGRNMPYEYGDKGRVTGFTDAGGNAKPDVVKLMETPCPFRLLYPVLGQEPELFLSLSRLFAGYLLMDRGVVDDVREFSLEWDDNGNLLISFRGVRGGVTRDDLPILVIVRETCRLEPATCLPSSRPSF
jgi:hypothetical protein